MRYLLTLFLCVLGHAGTINGQAFIATKGGESIKLGLVSVVIFERASADAYISRAKPEMQADVAKLLEEYKRLKAITDQQPTGSEHKIRGYQKQLDVLSKITARRERYYREMNATLHSSTKTDADGRFSVTVPETFYLAATSRRKIGKYTEVYVWLIPSEEISDPFFLSNDNAETWEKLY